MTKQATIALLLLGLTSSLASAKTIQDTPDPGNAALSTWTPAQQYVWHDKYGFPKPYGSVAFADTMGDKLSALGRLDVVQQCFDKMFSYGDWSIRWAICGDEVPKLDAAKVDEELKAEGFDDATRAEFAKRVKDVIAAAYGARDKAKTDTPDGLKKILEQAPKGRAEWDAYAAKHADELAQLAALEDAVRTGTKAPDCHARTAPAFAKLAQATKLPANPGSFGPAELYARLLSQSNEAYITSLAYTACAAANVDERPALVAYSAFAIAPHASVRRGPHTATIAYLLNIKGAGYSVDLDGTLNTPHTSNIATIWTPGGGYPIKTMTPDGANTKIVFQSGTVNTCLVWKETNKIMMVSPNGSITYDRKCVKRGNVYNETDDVEVPKDYAAGLAKGVVVTTVGGFPIYALKNDKVVAVFGAALK